MSSNQRSHQKDQSQHRAKTEKPKQKEKNGVRLSQMIEAPETLSHDEVIDAQQQLGNQVVQRALGPDRKRESVTDEQGNLHKVISDDIQQERGGGSPLPDDLRQEAGKRFEELATRFPERKLYTLYRERVQELRNRQLPPDWDGVFTHTSK